MAKAKPKTRTRTAKPAKRTAKTRTRNPAPNPNPGKTKVAPKKSSVLRPTIGGPSKRVVVVAQGKGAKKVNKAATGGRAPKTFRPGGGVK